MTKSKSNSFCLAPFVHTFCSPVGERRLCCASREPSTNFKQYIDSNESLPGDKDKLQLSTLHEHWNSEHMKDVRVRMMNDEQMPECEVCDKKLLNTSVYRDYFEHLFKHKRDELIEQTDPDGTLHVLPVSFDYRISNVCNFKCRMCGPMLSSAWEAEVRQHSTDINEHHKWMKPENASVLSEFRIESFFEMYDQLRKGLIEEVYWVGGEPLLMSDHWDFLETAIALRKSPDIRLRYNTNLSVISNQKTKTHADLFDYLVKFKDWEVCASIDGTGIIGEYIRTGLDYNQFIANFERGLEQRQHSRNLRLDFTLTTPGLFEIENMFNLSKKYNVPLLSKVCFEFTNDVAMCPLFLPKHVLHPILNELIQKLEPKADQNQQSIIDVMKNLLTRETMEEKYSDYEQGRRKGKKRIQELEAIRLGPTSFEEILAQNSQSAWVFWNSIEQE